MIVAHVSHPQPLPATRWLLLGLLGGGLASLGLLAAVRLQSTGSVPATVLGGVVLGTIPSRVTARQSTGVYLVGGTLAGLVAVLAALPLASVLPPVKRVAGLHLSAHVVGVALIGIVAYGAFVGVVLPRYGMGARDSSGPVRRHWAASVAVYVLVLAASVPVLSTVLN